MPTEPKESSAACDACEQIIIKAEFDVVAAALGADRDLAKLDYEHEITAGEADATALTALEKTSWDHEYALGTLFHTTITTVSQGSVDRARDSAKYVQTSAAAIAALYTGVLGLVFSVTSNALPIRGIWAPIFLALAVALATAYLAFITTPNPPPIYAGGASLPEMQINRTAFLVNWINSTVRNRSWALRASVISLAFGVAFIAAPFITSTRPADIPAAPTAPVIPTAIAVPVVPEATKLFQQQITDYRVANKARNKAITDASTASSSVASHENTLNRRAGWLGLAGLLVVLFGPVLYDRRPGKTKSGHSSAMIPSPVGFKYP